MDHPAGAHPVTDTRLTQLLDLQTAVRRWLDANTVHGTPPVIDRAEALSDAVDRAIAAMGVQPEPAARQAIAAAAAAVELYGDDALEAWAREHPYTEPAPYGCT